LRDKFTEDITGQSTRMDDLAHQLIALELAVPGLYATALKLIVGKQGAVAGGIWLFLAFTCWGLALAFALIGLIPRNYPVDRNRLSADEADKQGPPFSIEGYFRRSALYKRRLMLASCGLFFAGICCAAVTLS